VNRSGSRGRRGVPRDRRSRDSGATLTCPPHLTLGGSPTRSTSGYRATSAGTDGCGRARGTRRKRAAALLAEAVATAPGAPNVIVRALLSQCALAQQLDRPSDVLAAPPFRVIMAGACRIECEALAALGRAHEGLAALQRATASAVAMGAEPTRWRACRSSASSSAILAYGSSAITSTTATLPRCATAPG
jgi:hypothetical protein